MTSFSYDLTTQRPVRYECDDGRVYDVMAIRELFVYEICDIVDGSLLHDFGIAFCLRFGLAWVVIVLCSVHGFAFVDFDWV